jgi:signal transduction histidine kinase
VLAALREPAAQPVAHDVRALAERLSTPACPITVISAGPDAPLGVAGHLLLQEALTNAVRHAGASAVDVRIVHDRDAVTILVEDDGTGPGPSAHTEGAGIRGMRERARRLGGTLQISGRQPAGWRVHAHLPVR